MGWTGVPASTGQPVKKWHFHEFILANEKNICKKFIFPKNERGEKRGRGCWNGMRRARTKFWGEVKKKNCKFEMVKWERVGGKVCAGRQEKGTGKERRIKVKIQFIILAVFLHAKKYINLRVHCKKKKNTFNFMYDRICRRIYMSFILRLLGNFLQGHVNFWFIFRFFVCGGRARLLFAGVYTQTNFNVFFP